MAAPIGRFILRTAAWLPACFAVWFLAGPVVVWPAWAMSSAVVRVAFGEVFSAIERDGATFVFITRFRPDGAAAAAGAAVATFEVDGLIYTFGVPMLVALTLAARQPRLAVRLALCLVALVPFQSWGIVADALQAVSGGLGPAVSAQAGWSRLQRETIAFAYQFGHLVLPAVAPAVAWVAAHRDFLQRFAGPYGPRA